MTDVNTIAAQPEGTPEGVSRCATLPSGINIQYLDYAIQGPGKDTRHPIVFLAGLGYTAYVFQAFIEQFYATKKYGSKTYNPNKFRVIAMTRRGAGKSDQPSWGYDMDTRAQDIADLLTSLDLTQQNTHVTLVGHSIAGGEMTCFANKYPQWVSNLVYLDAFYDYTNPETQSIPEMNDFSDWLNYDIDLAGEPPEVKSPGYLAPPSISASQNSTIDGWAQYYNQIYPNTKGMGQTLDQVFNDNLRSDYNRNVICDQDSYPLDGSSSEFYTLISGYAQNYPVTDGWKEIATPILTLVPDYNVFATDYPWLNTPSEPAPTPDAASTPTSTPATLTTHLLPRTFFGTDGLRLPQPQKTAPPPQVPNPVLKALAIKYAKRLLALHGKSALFMAKYFRGLNSEDKKSKVSSVNVQVVPNSGHFLFVDQPSDVAAKILDFLG